MKREWNLLLLYKVITYQIIFDKLDRVVNEIPSQAEVPNFQAEQLEAGDCRPSCKIACKTEELVVITNFPLGNVKHVETPVHLALLTVKQLEEPQDIR